MKANVGEHASLLSVNQEKFLQRLEVKRAAQDQAPKGLMAQNQVGTLAA